MKTASENCPVTARFAKAAATYDSQPGIQLAIARRLARNLDGRSDIDADSILEVGCGTGFLTGELCRIFPQNRIVAIDIAGPMVDQVKRRLGWRSNLLLMQADVRELHMTEDFSLIVSSSAIHWMLPLEATFSRLWFHLRRNGRICFTMMLKGTLRELHTLRDEIAPRKMRRQNLPTAEEVTAVMRTNGFEGIHREQETQHVEYPSPSAFLRAIHRQGVTGGFTSSSGGLTRGEMRALTEEYQRRYALHNGKVYASYNILYAEGVKA